jgi:hypothetical protein
MADATNDYLTFDEACRDFNVTPAQLRRLLRDYGLGEFVRASMDRQVLLRRSDLEALVHSSRSRGGRRGIA